MDTVYAADYFYQRHLVYLCPLEETGGDDIPAKGRNALDEHLKDKEFIKEEELEKLIRHADKGIHAIARLNIKLILISLPILILFLAEVLLHNRLNPIYIIIIFAWIPALCWDIVTTRFLQRTQIDEMPLVRLTISGTFFSLR